MVVLQVRISAGIPNILTAVSCDSPKSFRYLELFNLVLPSTMYVSKTHFKIIYLFFCGLFNDAVSNSNYIP
jgi:hypothetical protein